MGNRNRFLRFQLERWIQRGVFHQLLFVAALIVAISVAGGLVAWGATGQFDDPLDAIWWSFLRLTDPGYLGDDEGAVLRIVSTVVTVLGYVLFMGSLIAIMTQWLSQTLRRYESGLAPISMSGHVVILGRTNRTPEIARQLLGAEGRLRRFLAERTARILRVVIVSDEVNAEQRSRLRSWFGTQWRERQIFLRAGSSLRLADLSRFDLPRAAAIIVPADEFRFGGSETSDAQVVKTLLNLRQILEPLPRAAWPSIVAEVFDPRKARIAEGALQGRLEVVTGDAVIARLVAQSIRDHRVAMVFLELLAHHHGCSPYVRRFPGLAGRHPAELDGRFDRAVVIGAVRSEDGRPVTYLNPAREFRLERDDMLVLIARAFEDCVITRDAIDAIPSESIPDTDAPTPSAGSVLVLGWSHKIDVILRELSGSDAPDVEVTLVSRRPQAERERFLHDFGPDAEQVRVRHIETDYTASALLADSDFHLQGFDTIVLLASTWMESAEAADARTIMGYELVKSVLADQLRDGGKRPKIILEFVHPASSRHYTDSPDVKLESPMILGYLQAHVALRPVLNSVFGELFVPGGAEVALRQPGEYGVAGGALSYRAIQRQACVRGEIVLGVLMAAGKCDEVLELCPYPDQEWSFAGDDAIVVMAAADA
ncbi:MAG: CASTOR/POLLUX-related putative ion channel [Gammaproteobacteria bacterium]